MTGFEKVLYPSHLLAKVFVFFLILTYPSTLHQTWLAHLALIWCNIYKVKRFNQFMPLMPLTNFSGMKWVKKAPVASWNYSKLLFLNKFTEAATKNKFVKPGVVNSLAYSLKNTYKFLFASIVTGKMNELFIDTFQECC